ncbi:tetratricopeptide repeat protein [Cellvibrio fibrivorans]|uniref:Tetratricopeptide (TPR) repeat protein n=1 Tax=Cellvibrio fibrivorans TaxID=126350 RepID=A0ABU1V1C5_9GAMM|nr:tetratricopeptide repeat protein [Cellvibrio fibrivorans]MDR7091257.1 tetratricopeptide (TPR) repeat protein [Cellvibrio fibrivorans]
MLMVLTISSAMYVQANESTLSVADNPGVVAFSQGRYQEAEDYFSQQLANPVQKNDSLIYLSRIAVDTGRVEAAVEHIEAVLKLEPNTAEEIVLAGDIYCNQAQQSSMFSALGLAKKCIAHYEAAVQQFPENTHALASAMRFYFEAPGFACGSSKKGDELLARLDKLSPEDANIYRVFLLEKEGKSDAAMALADKLSQQQFQSARNQYELARFYRDKNQLAHAMPLYESLRNKPATLENKWYVNDSLLQLGEILLAEKQDIRRSIELMEEYKQKNNNPHDQHYFWSSWSLAQAYKANGNEAKYALLVKQIQTEDYAKNPEFAKRFEAGIKAN